MSWQEPLPPAPAAEKAPGRRQPPAAAQRASFLRDLRIVWAEHDFRRLFSTRLISQTGDGLFTAGLGGYVFFNATNFPNPASGAAAFAVLYLPYSLIGPFAGVFIDRWSRRQILVCSALIRSVFVAITAGLVASGKLGVPLYVGVLAVLGVNRFFLSALSAALPHVVPADKLVMANSVSPTAGGIMAAIGGIAGLGVHVALHGGRGEYAATLLVAGCCYIAAGLVSATMARDLLGPQHGEGEPRARPDLGRDCRRLAGLVAGARYIAGRRRPAAALAATGANRLLLRHLVPDVDPALPELLLSRRRRQQGARPLCVADSTSRRRLRGSGFPHPDRDQAAEQARVDRPAAHSRRAGHGCARPAVRPGRRSWFWASSWDWPARASRSARRRSCRKTSVTTTAAGRSRSTT